MSDENEGHPSNKHPVVGEDSEDVAGPETRDRAKISLLPQRRKYAGSRGGYPFRSANDN